MVSAGGSRGVSRRSVLVATASAAVAATATVSAEVPAHAAAAEPIKVGTLFDLTGPDAGHGARQLAGARHQSWLIEKGFLPGHRNVTLIERDTKGDVEATKAAVRDLIEQEKVHALVGTSLPGTTATVIDAAQAAGVPLVVPAVTGGDAANGYVFSSTAEYGADMIRAIAKAQVPLKQTRVATMIGAVWVTPAFYQGLDRLPKAGLESVAVEEYKYGTEDFTPQLKAMLEKNPDVLGLHCIPPGNSLAVSQARELGWTGPIYCSPAAAHPDFLKRAGAAAEGVRSIVPWSMVYRDAPETLSYWQRMYLFSATFEGSHGPAGPNVSFTADAVGLLATAFADTDDRAQARDRLEALDYQGVTGHFTAGQNHRGLPDGTLTAAVVRDGKFVLDR